MLNLERLRVLHAVMTTGSVGGAASGLQVTTSAVSQQLARLEREVNQQLLERQGRGIRLTQAGELLARHAGDLLTHVERAESDLAAHRGAVDGTLTIGAFATALRGLLPAVLADLRTRHPDLAVSLAEQEPHEAIPAVRRGSIDIAVVQDWAEDVRLVPEDLQQQDLLADPFDVAVPADHPFADRSRIELGELSGENWISWSSGQICHDWLLRRLRTDLPGVPEPRITHLASEQSTQLALVAAGLGVVMVPRLGRDAVPPQVRFVPIDPPPTRHVHALWRTSSDARPAIAASLEALRKHGAAAERA